MGRLRALSLLLPALLLVACTPTQQVEVEPPIPPLPTPQAGSVARPEVASLSPLAKPEQVMAAVDLGRRDPFAAVLTPRPISPMASKLAAPKGGANHSRPLLALPKGLVLQGVLQGRKGGEALVEYTPSESNIEGTRSGSLHVGDVGSGRGDSLLPSGWRVRHIDVARGLVVLQAGQQFVTLEL